MLGKIPPFVLLIVGPLLIAAVIVGAYIYMYMPKQKEIAQVTADAVAQEQKADTLGQEEVKLDLAKEEWVTAHEGLAQKMDERSIPISMAHPTTAMISLWKEVREDLPVLVEKFIKESGCVIIKGHPGWTAPTTPFPATSTWIEAPLGQQASGSHPILQPSSQSVENWNPLAPRVEYSGSSTLAAQKQSDQRYMALASRAVNANLPASIQVAGKIENIERLYKSLRNFPRVMTIQHLILTKLDSQFLGDDVNWISERLDADPDELVLADIAMTIWVLCEAPEAAPAAAAGGGMMGGAAGGMPGASGGAMGGMPGMSGGGAAGGMMPGAGASGGGPGATDGGAAKGSSEGSKAAKSSSEAE